MFRRNVTAPDGRRWTVGRRWLSRRRRLARADLSDATPDFLDFGGADDLGVLGMILAAIALFFVTIFLVLVLFNVVAIAIELTLVIFLLVAGVFGRVVLRRPWIVRARNGDTSHEWPVVGWRASRRTIADVSERLRSGAQLDPAPGDRR